MAYTLTTQEFAEVRMQLGGYLTPDKLTDEQISSDSILEAAVDYVFFKVIDYITVGRLNSTQRPIVDALLNGSSDDFDTFVSDVLLPRQQRMFRRAVVYRTAGNSATIVKWVDSEGVEGFATSVELESISDKQEDLYTKCDEEVVLIRDSFPQDPISDLSEVAGAKSKRFVLMAGAETPVDQSGSDIPTGGQTQTPTIPPGTTVVENPFSIIDLAEGTIALDDYVVFAAADGTMERALVSALKSVILEGVSLGGDGGVDLSGLATKTELQNAIDGLGDLATLDDVGTNEIEDNAITKAKILDRAITLAKLATGTAGKLIGFNDSGVPTELNQFSIADLATIGRKANTDQLAIYDSSESEHKRLSVSALLSGLALSSDLGALALLETIGSSNIDNGAITESKVASRAITLAKQATGTAGKRQGWDTSGNPAELDPELNRDESATVAALEDEFWTDRLTRKTYTTRPPASGQFRWIFDGRGTPMNGAFRRFEIFKGTEGAITDKIAVNDYVYFVGSTQFLVAKVLAVADIANNPITTRQIWVDTPIWQQGLHQNINVTEAGVFLFHHTPAASSGGGGGSSGGTSLTVSAWRPTFSAPFPATTQTQFPNFRDIDLGGGWHLGFIRFQMHSGTNWNTGSIRFTTAASGNVDFAVGLAGDTTPDSTVNEVSVAQNGGILSVNVRKPASDASSVWIGGVVLYHLTTS